MKRLILVGEDNPYSADPSFALYHLPRGVAGDRLRAHLGLRDATYAGLEKVNLCLGKWTAKEANARAGEILVGPYDVVVMLGAKVRRAFLPKASVEFFGDYGGLVSLPHPSGRCLL